METLLACSGMNAISAGEDQDQPEDRAPQDHAVALAKMPLGKATSTTTNSPNSISGIQLTAMKGVTAPSNKPSNTPGDERPEGLSESSQHRHHEALHLVTGAGKNGEGKQGRDQCPRSRRQRDADGECQRQHHGRGDAHQLRRFAVVGHGPDGLARPGAIQKQLQRQRNDDRSRRPQQCGFR